METINKSIEQTYKGYRIDHYPDDRKWYVIGSDPTGGWSVGCRTLAKAKAYIDGLKPRQGEEHSMTQHHTPYDQKIYDLQAKEPLDRFQADLKQALENRRQSYLQACSTYEDLLAALKGIIGQLESLSEIRWFKKNSEGTLIHIQQILRDALPGLKETVAKAASPQEQETA